MATSHTIMRLSSRAGRQGFSVTGARDHGCQRAPGGRCGCCCRGARSRAASCRSSTRCRRCRRAPGTPSTPRSSPPWSAAGWPRPAPESCSPACVHTQVLEFLGSQRKHPGFRGFRLPEPQCTHMMRRILGTDCATRPTLLAFVPSEHSRHASIRATAARTVTRM